MSKKQNPRQKVIICLTDLHIRSDYVYGYLDAQINTLTKLVNAKPPDAVVINGDIFNRRNPKGDELLAFRRLLDGLKTPQIVVNVGNHDEIIKQDCQDTTLSLFEDSRVKVVKETEIVNIAGYPFAVIPYYSDETKIVEHIKNTAPYPIFGHFGFDGCYLNTEVSYDSYIKRGHFKNRLTLLGHIHKPRVYTKDLMILGTQYSCNFGEFNTQKMLHQIIITGDKLEVVRTPIEFGIRHITGTIDELDTLNKKFKFADFFTLLRVKVDNLDSFAAEQIKQDIFSKYKVKHLELVFDDFHDKFSSEFHTDASIASLDDSLIDRYVKESDTIFKTEELIELLEEIKERV